MSLIRTAILFLSIILTSLGLFAQGHKTDRTDLFRVGYLQLPFAVSFLFDSPTFMSQLTPNEAAQLQAIFGSFEQIKHVDMFRRSGNLLAAPDTPMIEFLPNREAFKLNPDEPERLAKTTERMGDPIYINETLLNSKNIDPTYMDVLQILFHEMGHKLGAAKDQQAIDSLGAKMMQFLKPYYQRAELVSEQDPNDRARVEILSLPREIKYLTTSMSETVRILVNANGVVGYHTLDFSQAVGPLKRFTERAGNFQEELTIRLTDMKKGDLGHFRASVNFNLEIKSRVVFINPNVNFIGVGATIGNTQYMRTTNQTLDILQPNVSNISSSLDLNRPEEGYRSPQYYVPSFGRRDYPDDSFKFKVSHLTQDGNTIRMQVSSKDLVNTAQLRVQAADTMYLVNGRVGKTAEGASTLSFEVPKNLAHQTGELKMRDIILNSQSRSLLPEVLSMKVKVAEPVSLRRIEVSIFDGQNFKPYVYSEIAKLPPGPARMRVTLESDTDVSQLRLRWSSGALIKGGKDKYEIGIYASQYEETVNEFKLVESANGKKTYEFYSQGSIARVLPKPLAGVEVHDSYRRVLREVEATSAEMESSSRVYADYEMIFNAEHLVVTPKATVLTCSGLF